MRGSVAREFRLLRRKNSNCKGIRGLYSRSPVRYPCRIHPRKEKKLTSSAHFSLRLALVSLTGAAVLMAGLFTSQTAGAAEPIKGSMVAYNTALEKKKCNAKKAKTKTAKRAKAKCLRTAKARGTASTRKMMSTPRGLYGYGLKPAAIPSRNGTLIWNKKTTTVEGAARTDFVLYSSKSFPGNRNIAVSGTFSVPSGTPPAGGWPVLSWAHGTTGIADQCAPSRMIGSQGYYMSESTELIEGWLEDGYAVLKTDYEGLGTPGVHPYLIGVSEARGVLDIVRAARTANPKLSKRVVITGHSQGGHAALFAAQEAPKWSKDFDHLGTVPYAPPADLQLQAAGIGALPADAYGISALAATILRGAVVRNPSIDPAAILTEEAFQHYSKTETLCLGELSEEFAATETGPGDLLRPGVLFQPAGAGFSEVLEEMDPQIRTNRPVLIIQGLQDTTVQPGLTNTLVTRLGNLNPGLIAYERFGCNLPDPDGVGPEPDPCPGPDAPNETVGQSTHSSILIDATSQVDVVLLDWYFPT